MDLVSEEHELLQLAFAMKNNVVAQKRIVMQNHQWKQADPGKRMIYVLSVPYYDCLRRAGADLENLDEWEPLDLCDHHVLRATNCVYCQASVLNPDITLQEIETAILEASGTFAEREVTVIQQLCCSDIKPAKR